MKRNVTTTTLMVLAIAAFSGAMLRAIETEGQEAAGAAPKNARVERGAYLVGMMGCNDCHTPWKVGPKGPEPDMARALTGHPAGLVMPPPPAPSGPWIWSGAATNTAFAGPWGVSFTANLTPDKETGLGSWTEEMFIKTIRTGKHQGEGRNLLPPMPWPVYKNMTDDDLKATWAFLRSLPPINNAVPDPVPPPQSAAAPIPTASQQ